MIGQTLGHYHIVEKLGEGGMGEVFLAEDLRLQRRVAIKILPTELASEPERRARFEREAKIISTLSHPNICSLFDIGEHDGRLYLVMELLEGETLATRLEKGAMPASQLLRYGAEIAAALSEAHRQSVIHRDLKPGNVILTSTGAKLLDFGLAKTAEAAGATSDPLLSAVPTEEQPLTEQGTLLGTYPYMAPEQVEGLEADARSDIFALGAMLYEMATGQRAFEGSSRASLLAAILERDPQAVSSVQPHLPAALDYIVMTCLAKDPEDRWQDARDVASQLRWVSQGSSQTEIGAAAPRRRNRPWPSAVAALLLAGSAFLVGWWSRVHEPSPVVRASLELPVTSSQLAWPTLTLSPDGTKLAFVARNEVGGGNLWLRPLGEATARMLSGTETTSGGGESDLSALHPFWSSDSSQLAFFADGKLKRIDADGGAVLTLCDAPAPRGGTWSRSDVIVFVPRPQAGLFRVAASGGTPIQVTTIAEGSAATHRWPRFLPDGKHLLFFLTHDPERPEGLYLANIDTGEYHLLVEESSEGRIVSDRLLYHRDGNLLARRFDPRSLELTGPPVPVVQNILFNGLRWEMSLGISQRAIVYLEDNSPLSQLVWFDRQGDELSRVGEPAVYGRFSVSPDGTRAIMENPPSSERAFTLFDTTTGTRQNFTLHEKALFPLWSADGRQVVFTAETEDSWDLIVTESTGSGNERLLLSSPKFMAAGSWSPEGDLLIFASQDPTTGMDIWTISTDGSGEPELFLQTRATEAYPLISPDGDWLAYLSDESGRNEVYVTSFPDPHQKWQVTTRGAIRGPTAWSRDGSEILFASFDGAEPKLWTISIEEEGQGLRFGQPQPQLGGRDLSDVIAASAVGDLSRFLVAITQDDPGPVNLKLVLDWMNELEN